jgi:ankyrin repeat protein
MSAYEAAYNAVVGGDIAAFLRIVEADRAIISADDGIILLDGAARHGQLRLVQELVARGVNINSMVTPPDPEGVIVSAANEGHLDVVQWLLDHGAAINYIVANKVRCPALTGAIVNGHFDVVRLLVSRGADVNAQGGRTTPLGYAAMFRRQNIADYLQSVGAVQV